MFSVIFKLVIILAFVTFEPHRVHLSLIIKALANHHTRHSVLLSHRHGNICTDYREYLSF